MNADNHLIIQFPFADSRGFIASSGRLDMPVWPLPTPDREFVRYHGPVRLRRRGGLSGWVGENKVCEARRCIRLLRCPSVDRRSDGRRYATRVAFKRLYFDGFAVGKLELGLTTKTRRPADLGGADLGRFVEAFLGMPVHVQSPAGKGTECDLFHAGKHLAALYRSATTSTCHASPLQEEWWVQPGIPVVFLECSAAVAQGIPFRARMIPVKDFAFEVFHCLVPFQGTDIRLWIAGSPPKVSEEDTGALRRLRIYLLRLQAEHECLRLVLRHLIQRRLKAASRSDESQELQRYLNEATRRIGILEAKSCKQFGDRIGDIARESLNIMAPGQRDALATVLRKLDIRPNVMRKVDNYAAKWANVTIIDGIGGDYVQGDKRMSIDDHSSHINARDIVNSQVGQTLTNCTNLVQGMEPGMPRDLLEKLDRDVRVLISRLPADKQEEAAGNHELLVKAATAQIPNRRWYEVSADVLLEASKWVKDFSGNIAGTILQLGKYFWPEFTLPVPDPRS
ncbi:hypothetical protein JW905_14470 [bacterium]|nr:hypothetical protein [candidate division CSSED10-310 bacterium]